MIRLLFQIFLIGTISLVVTGCSDDDDCPSCPRLEQPDCIVTGTVSLAYGRLDTWLEAYIADGREADIDSVLVGDRSVLVQSHYFIYDSHETELASGDTVVIKVFAPNGEGTCSARLLHYYDDAPTIFYWSGEWPFDTVAAETDIELEWKTVSHADWYELRTIYTCDSLGTRVTYTNRYSLTDTSYTILGSGCLYEGFIDIRVTAMTGPMPGEPNNVAGEGFTGVILGFANETSRIYIR